ncbi:isochorismatase family protein [Actinomadura sp. 7K507]|uniref:isochorismatase family protein n=1 Tax=Actinomadura sp. 7K507 TaxID=2530365 RepID=UPI00104D013E|nr:isochorismatase family protein [Actinomadura sp. 7K507]TDC92037.1 isochorismatase family protein [Actinomadura sp. 7K507]
MLEATYTEAGFGRPVRRGHRPAVVVVDFSEGFTDPSFPTGADMSAEVEACAVLLASARERGFPRVFTTIAHDSPHDATTWWDKAPGLRTFMAGSRAVRLDERLGRRADEALVVKRGPSAFHGTDLAGRLTRDRADTVIVCGATTSGCVRATVVDAMQLGYPVLVPRECVADRARGPHEASLFDMNQKYADVVTLAETLAHLAGITAAD